MMYTTFSDAKNTLINSGILEMLKDEELFHVATIMWEDQVTPEKAAEALGIEL